MKAYGKKNPDIQNTLGVPFLTQPLKNTTLSIRSYVQLARGFKLKNPFSAHNTGT